MKNTNENLKQHTEEAALSPSLGSLPLKQEISFLRN